MKYLVVIPARGGSKGIPLKNIVQLNGRPLIEYTLDIATALKNCADILVSTDSNEIKNLVEKVSDIQVINRPAEISGDNASTEEALLHAITYMKKYYNKEYEAVITLQPSSPFRKINTVRDFIEKFELISDKYDALLSLTESSADYWQKRGDDFFRLFPEAPRKRQFRTPIYIENSALYITKIEALEKTKSVLGTRATGYIIAEDESMDINEIRDLQIAKAILKMSTNC